MITLGIETSCDETAVGIVDGMPDAPRQILANRIISQYAEHTPYGGVVPEIAARAHLTVIDPLVRAALDEAKLTLNDLDGIAATNGPGLIGGVMVGAMFAKGIAAARGLPFVAVNHLEAHALTARLTHDVAFPYLLLLISGGHCQLLLVKGVGQFHRLGGTLDDAAGECFDKGAKLLGLGFPGGPAIEKAAQTGNPTRFDLPRPLLGRAGCDFSFSGLKTALRQLVSQQTKITPEWAADAAASLQSAIADILADRVRHAFMMLEDSNLSVSALVAAGGVAANQAIRHRLEMTTAQFSVPCIVPPPALCTDNGVMVAWAGLERLAIGLTDRLDVAARPRWPLSEEIAR